MSEPESPSVSFHHRPVSVAAEARLSVAGGTLGDSRCRPRDHLQPGGRDHCRAGGRGVPGLPPGNVQRGARGSAPFPHAPHARGRTARRHLSLALVAGPARSHGGRVDLGHPGFHLGAGGRGTWDRCHDPGVSSGRRHDPGAGPVHQVGGLDHHDRHGRVGGPGRTDRPDRFGVWLLPRPGAEAAAQRAANPHAGRSGGRRRRHLPGPAGRRSLRRRGALLVHGLRVRGAPSLPGQLDRGLLDVCPVHHAEADLQLAPPDLSGTGRPAPVRGLDADLCGVRLALCPRLLWAAGQALQAAAHPQAAQARGGRAPAGSHCAGLPAGDDRRIRLGSVGRHRHAARADDARRTELRPAHGNAACS